MFPFYSKEVKMNVYKDKGIRFVQQKVELTQKSYPLQFRVWGSELWYNYIIKFRTFTKSIDRENYIC